MFKSFLKRIAAASVSVALVSCGTQPVKPVESIVQPKARPVHNLTSFSESLSCMDRMFLDYGIQDIVLTSQGIPDATGEIRTGTKEMLISAISRMSTRSGAFRFVDYDQRQLDINALQNLVGFTQDFLVPNYYIRGAITQFDEQVLSQSQSGGVSLKMFDAGRSQDKTTSLVTIDMNVGDLLTRQILAGTSGSNTIAVSRSGKSTDMNGSIDKLNLGFSFNVNLNQSEGMHQSVRTLLQLSVIEALGKLAEVPYWRCLGIGQTSAAMMDQAQDWYDGMSASEKVIFAKRALAGLGLYQGTIDEHTRNSDFLQAVGAYQNSQGLLADGQVNFQLYAALIADDIALKKRPEANKFAKAKSVAKPVVQKKIGLDLTLPKTTGQQYTVGETLSISVKIDQDAYAYCYYQDGNKNVVRIFPNRFQPNALITANAAVSIPGVKSQFEIVLEQSGATEEILCIASSEELGIYLPDNLKQVDLTPLPVSSLNDIGAAFKSLNREETVSAKVAVFVES